MHFKEKWLIFLLKNEVVRSESVKVDKCVSMRRQMSVIQRLFRLFKNYSVVNCKEYRVD